MGNSDYGTTYMTVGGDDWRVRPSHYIYAHSITRPLRPACGWRVWKDRFWAKRERLGDIHGFRLESGKARTIFWSWLCNCLNLHDSRA